MPSNSAFEYPITQGFGPTNEKRDGPYKGYANFNKGYDYAAPAGTPVPAQQVGTVIAAGNSGDGWGISVKVRDHNGFVHNYGHLGPLNVRVGDTIERGQIIGAVGKGGQWKESTSGPHLSYDVYRADTGEFIDPAPWVGGGNMTMNNGQFQTMPDRGGPTGFQTMPDRGGPTGFQTMPGTGSGGGSDPLLAALQNAIRQASLATDPDTADTWANLAKNLAATWKGLNPNTPLDIALKQYELETLARNQQRTDIREDRRDDVAQWRDQNTLAQNAYQNQRTEQADSIVGPKGAYDTRSQWVKDQNAIADANYTNQLNYFDREALQDTQQLNYAAADIKRALDAKDEARQRATQIDKTLMDAAGWALPPGTEYYPGREPTSLFAQAARGAGMTWDDNLYRVPEGMTNDTASIRINPAERLRQQDAEMGVSGPVPNVPEFVRRTPPPVPTQLSAPDPSNLISAYQNLQPVKPPSFSMDNYPPRPEVPSMPTPPDLAALDREQRERFIPPPSIYNTTGLQVTPPPRDIRGDYAPVAQPQASASTGGGSGGIDPETAGLLALLGVGGLGSVLGYKALMQWRGAKPQGAGTSTVDDIIRALPPGRTAEEYANMYNNRTPAAGYLPEGTNTITPRVPDESAADIIGRGSGRAGNPVGTTMGAEDDVLRRFNLIKPAISVRNIMERYMWNIHTPEDMDVVDKYWRQYVADPDSVNYINAVDDAPRPGNATDGITGQWRRAIRNPVGTAMNAGVKLLPPGTSVPQIPAVSSWQLPNAIPMPPSRQQAGESLVEFLKRMGKAASRVK